MKTANLKSHTTSEMNWNIYFQAFTVRTWRKRLSNLNTFLTPHIYWGIHIKICVNYNQHMVAAILVLFIMADRKKMIPSTLLWPSAIFLKKMELMFSIQELTTNMRHLLKRQLMLTTQALIFSCQYIETLLKSQTSILVLKLLYTMIQDLSQRLQET